MPTPLAQLQLSVTPVVSGLTNPIGIVDAQDGSDRLFVIEQTGQIRIVQNGRLLNTPFLDIADRLVSGGEQGLLGLAFPPDYASKGHFYVHYTDRTGDTVIARYRLGPNANQADASSEQVILTLDQPFSNHNGGQLAFGPDGYLYVGLGDGGGTGDPQNNAQNPNTLLGKLLRLDVESGAATYTIPADNPFRSPTDGVRDEIWASGLRNPWRFSFDRQTGDLYIADVGQQRIEEVNFQPVGSSGGENYGWRRFEGTLDFNNSSSNTTGLTFPVTQYDHSQGVSVTGGYVYRGAAASELQGVYLYADFANGKIWGLRRSGNTWETALLLDTEFNISSFGEDRAGNLYVADYSGAIYRIEPPLLSSQSSPGNDLLTGTAGADTLRGLGGDDRLFGLGGRDLLVGNGGRDTLEGGSGKDTLRGGQGGDWLRSGNGSDRLSGGRGPDRFGLELGPGRDRIVDFQDGSDRLELADGLSFGALEIVQRRDNTLIRSGGEALALLEGIRVNQIDQGDFVMG
jgi:glucose/arabinose dehydrogenase